MSTFAELLKTHRIQTGVTQNELCKRVNEALRLAEADGPLTQATVSAWESGRQRPSLTKREQLHEIARLLNIDLGLLDESLGGQLSPAHDLPDDAYAEDVRQWVRTATPADPENSEPTRIWMIAPQVLPAFSDRSAAIASLWKDNLDAGVCYNLFWVLQEIGSSDVFQKLAEFLAAVDALHGEGSDDDGTISIYLIRKAGTELSLTQSLCANSFAHFRQEQKRAPTSKLKVFWEDLGDFSGSQLDIQMESDVSKWSGPLHSRLAVYDPPDQSTADPQASLLLTDTRSTLQGPVERVYRWLSPTDANALHLLVTNLEQWVQLKLPKAHELPLSNT